jgi:hypothetical protein
MSAVGVLGYGALARVGPRGAVAIGDRSADRLDLDWLVGADDRWHIPSEEAGAYQHRPGPAPIFESAVRVPGGEVAHTTYGATAAGRAGVVVEVDNRSAAPLTIGLVLRVVRRGVVEVEGTVVRVDGVPALVASRPAGAWAAGESTSAVVLSGDAGPPPVDRLEGPIELALLFPVPHRTTLRVALGDLCCGPDGTPVNVRELPGADAVALGWERQLERGAQAELPSPIGEYVDAARADLLLASRREPAVFIALEDWGFDDEAETAWGELGVRARQRARKRTVPAEPWAAVRAVDPEADPARFLSALRGALVRESSSVIDLLPGFPPDWLGQSITVEALPLRSGPLSFAVRWHGARPALLWDAPSGVELRAPVLDPAWSSKEAAGETLLAEPSMSLLPMGTQQRSVGNPVEAPGQFT